MAKRGNEIGAGRGESAPSRGFHPASKPGEQLFRQQLEKKKRKDCAHRRAPVAARPAHTSRPRDRRRLAPRRPGGPTRGGGGLDAPRRRAPVRPGTPAPPGSGAPEPAPRPRRGCPRCRCRSGGRGRRSCRSGRNARRRAARVRWPATDAEPGERRRMAVEHGDEPQWRGSAASSRSTWLGAAAAPRSRARCAAVQPALSRSAEVTASSADVAPRPRRAARPPRSPRARRRRCRRRRLRRSGPGGRSQ